VCRESETRARETLSRLVERIEPHSRGVATEPVAEAPSLPSRERRPLHYLSDELAELERRVGLRERGSPVGSPRSHLLDLCSNDYSVSARSGRLAPGRPRPLPP